MGTGWARGGHEVHQKSSRAHFGRVFFGGRAWSPAIVGPRTKSTARASLAVPGKRPVGNPCTDADCFPSVRGDSSTAGGDWRLLYKDMLGDLAMGEDLSRAVLRLRGIRFCSPAAGAAVAVAVVVGKLVGKLVGKRVGKRVGKLA